MRRALPRENAKYTKGNRGKADSFDARPLRILDAAGLRKQNGQLASDSDTVTGANLRWNNNLFQAILIAVALPIGVAVGYFSMADQQLGLMVDGLDWRLTGLFGSGIVLMIDREVRHRRGKNV